MFEQRKWDYILSVCIRKHLSGEEGFGNLNILSSLMARSARPSTEHLIDLELSQHHQSQKSGFRDCCLKAITSAINPLVPGMNLSLDLASAASEAPEGDQPRIREVQASVDALLLEIFERLPQTVRAVDGGIAACTAVLERSKARAGDRGGFTGPLGLMLAEKKQRETFCAEPLVMDYLSQKFSLGLPYPIDSEGVLSDGDKLSYMVGVGAREGIHLVHDAGLVLHRLHLDDQDENDDIDDEGHRVMFGPSSYWASLSIRTLLQGARASFPSLTILPGVQFMAAGLLAMPNDFYRVPAMRMFLHFVVYVGMLIALGYFVLFHSTPPDDGFLPDSDEIVDRPLGVGEAAVASMFIVVRSDCCLRRLIQCETFLTVYHMYLLPDSLGTLVLKPISPPLLRGFLYPQGGFVREVREMSNLKRYIKDQWNVLDLLGLVFLFIGLIIRVADSVSELGPAFYALSVPMLVCRVLFFAQVLPFQGPMIQASLQKIQRIHSVA